MLFIRRSSGTLLAMFSTVFSIIRRLGRYLRRAVLALVLVAVLGPVLVVLPLRWVDPPVTSFMIQNRAAMKAGGVTNPEFDFRWVPMAQISKSMALAAVAHEDQLFPTHSGFDWNALKQAYEDNQTGNKVRGASTITQQTVKNLYLWSQKSYSRKVVEAYLSGWMELLLTKHRILEIYLNIAQFDSRVYGAEAAAQKFFKVPAAKLSREQAALLAVALPAPSKYKVEQPSDYMRKKQKWVLKQMRQLGIGHLQPVFEPGVVEK